MRWLFALALLLVSGCADVGSQIDLAVTSYEVGPSTWVCCDSKGGSVADIQCPDNKVHRLAVRAPGATHDELALDRWRVEWDDGHQTGVSLKFTSEEPHHAFEPVLLAHLSACPPEIGRVIRSVELRDGDGARIGRASASLPAEPT